MGQCAPRSPCALLSGAQAPHGRALCQKTGSAHRCSADQCLHQQAPNHPTQRACTDRRFRHMDHCPVETGPASSSWHPGQAARLLPSGPYEPSVGTPNVAGSHWTMHTPRQGWEWTLSFFKKRGRVLGPYLELNLGTISKGCCGRAICTTVGQKCAISLAPVFFAQARLIAQRRCSAYNRMGGRWRRRTSASCPFPRFAFPCCEGLADESG